MMTGETERISVRTAEDKDIVKQCHSYSFLGLSHIYSILLGIVVFSQNKAVTGFVDTARAALV